MNRFPNPDLKNRIYRYLQTSCLGETNAKTGASIAKEFDTEWRAVASIIRQLRIDGILIGSSKGGPKTPGAIPKKLPGYYIPQTRQEIDNYFESFKDELFDMLKTFNRQKRARAKFISEQQTKDLFDFKYNPAGQKEFALCER